MKTIIIVTLMGLVALIMASIGLRTHWKYTKPLLFVVTIFSIATILLVVTDCYVLEVNHEDMLLSWHELCLCANTVFLVLSRYLADILKDSADNKQTS